MRKARMCMRNGSFCSSGGLSIFTVCASSLQIFANALSIASDHLSLTTSTSMTSVATAWKAEPEAAPAIAWPRSSKPGVCESAVSTLVGRNLRRLRRQHRISLEELARRSGVSRAMLGQIEQAKSVPSIKTLWQVAQALDVSVSWFLEPGNETRVMLIPGPPESPFVLPSGEAELRSLQQTGDGGRDGFFEIRLAPGSALSLPAATQTRRINVG